MKQFEQNITQYEQLANKIIRVDKKLAKKEKELAKRGGIYGTADKGNLPSSFVRKQQKQNRLGLGGGRLDDSSTKLTDEKIKPSLQESKLSITESVMNALGIKTKKSKLKKDSLVSGAGSPIQKNVEFKKLKDKVGSLETNQKTFAKIFSQGQSLVGGAAALTSVGGIAGSLTSVATKLPFVAAIIGIITLLVSAHLDQYKPGGIRDKRKKILASDTSLIGIDNENILASGEILFFSNPASLQGLPRGNSNTINLRDGISRYRQRHQGSY